ncbi:MAG: hypothetical protein LBN30_09715 [Oscillospiraceae bacterium]|jgi:hypothetical protein|nr:hypothetical protein [Oscillospiraceae bacterium]
MGFITNTFDVKTLVGGLRAEKGAPVTAGGGGHNLARATLDPYIYERLYLPIVQEGVIPVADLDFARITDAAIASLESALEASDKNNYLKLGNAITALPPSSARKSIFI